ncbi:hypothetical protein HGA92_01550 [Candidatus Gracilibacteria bacterium]|nr:hypothetical protein [Candidatus Gracilibacteria bacterium]NUJ98706.1 hypothetical protein [Candidatus Gracilibacteria bacterium]
MPLDEIDSFESGDAGADNSPEISEKFKEAAKKAAAGVKGTKRDEAKAKKYDFLLSAFLVKIILDKKYDSLLKQIFSVMDKGYPSNFILGILSLVYEPISLKMREVLTAKELYSLQIPKNTEKLELHNSDLSDDIKKRINYWIEDIIDTIVLEPSSVYTKRILGLINDDEEVEKFISDIFVFFFEDLNFIVSEKRANSFAKFIVGEVKKVIFSLEIEEI